VFENRVLRRIFGPKRDEVMRGWRKLHNEELHSLYYSSSIIRMIKSRRMRWERHVARMGAKVKAYMILAGKARRRRPLGRQRHRWVDNNKIDLSVRPECSGAWSGAWATLWQGQQQPLLCPECTSSVQRF
jgi:hypothetical protein